MRHGGEGAHAVLSSGPVQGATKVVEFQGCVRYGGTEILSNF
jgi:hypothetical protein